MADKRVFGSRTGTFKESYPNIRRAIVTVGPNPGNKGSLDRQRYTESDIPSKVPCSNPDCHGDSSGHDLSDLLSKANTDGKAAGKVSCRGDENGKKNPRRCMNRIDVVVEAELHTPPT